MLVSMTSQRRHRRQGFAGGREEEFADFVEQTRSEFGALALVLTGEEAAAADVLERAYADLRLGFDETDRDNRARLRSQLLRRAAEARHPEALPDHPEEATVVVDPDRIGRLAARTRTRRGLLTVAIGLPVLAGLGLGAANLLGRDPEPPVEHYGGLTVGESVAVELTPVLTVSLDLVIGRGGAEMLGVRHDDRVIALVEMSTNGHILSLPNPTNEYQQVLVCQLPSAQWASFHAPGDDPVMAHVELLNGHCIGVAVGMAELGFTAVVAGTHEGKLFSRSATSVGGLWFEQAAVWVWVVDGTLYGRHKGELLRVNAPEGSGIDITWVEVPGGAAVYYVPPYASDEGIRVSGAGSDKAVIQHDDLDGYYCLVPTPGPILHWTNSAGDHGTLDTTRPRR